jgi:imidazolonepropionase-like amidohydrolase
MVTLPRAAHLILLALGLAIAASNAGNAQTIALVGGTVYLSPTAAPIADAVVVASSGVITMVGKRTDVQVPPESRLIDCTGKTVVAGFWNSHIHLTEPAWKDAGNAPAEALTKHMQEMLTQWGFATVWDLGSDARNSLALRRRVDTGEVPGPKIYLTGSLFPKGGHPIYLPPEMRLPEAAAPDEATRITSNQLAMGLDGMKLFTGSYMGDKPVVNMGAAVARAAVDVARAQSKPVFAHPQNKTGVDVVLAAGVGILAHTVPTERGYTSEQLASFKSQGTALVPTLALWATVVGDPAISKWLIDAGVSQLKVFSDNGGLILFGTDVGFTKLYDTSLEYELMARALSPAQILASLTTNPAAYFKAEKKGRTEVGFEADFAVLDGDPITDARNLAKVAYTIRGGQIIYQRP